MHKKLLPWPEHEARRMLSFVDPDSRDTWMDAAMGIKSEFGDAGFDIWNDWSQQSDKYKSSSAKSLWRSLKSHGKTIGTIAGIAGRNGYSFNSDDNEISEEEIERRNEIKEKERKRSIEQERRERKAAAEQANNIWNNASPLSDGNHPYIIRKKIIPADTRIGDFPRQKANGEWVTEKNVMIIPIMNQAGEIVSLQGIFSEKPYGFTTDKTYLKNGQKNKCFYKFDGDKNHIVFCEGFATGASLFIATGYTVVVCFDRTNVFNVAEDFKRTVSGAKFIIAADNDRWTDGNPGVADAKKTALHVYGRMVCPEFEERHVTGFSSDKKGPTDFNDVHCLYGIDAVAEQVIEKEKEKPEMEENIYSNEYFTFLGFGHDAFYYMSHASGQVIPISRAGHTKNALLGLAPLRYWAQKYPNKSGDPSWDNASSDMIEMSQNRGMYTGKNIRGRGAWIDDGRIVYHMGPYLLVDNQPVKAHEIKSRFIYQRDEPLPEPDEHELTDEEGAHLLDIAKAFRWNRSASAPLLAGFVVLAPVCGALDWRPHVWITGGAGSGKTTVLKEYVDVLTDEFAINASGNSTEAGIRQTLRGDALPVIFDESEQNNEREKDRVQNIIAMIRQSSSNTRATVLKGTVGGKSLSFSVRSMFCLASIQTGISNQADIDRLTKLTLRSGSNDTGWQALSDMLFGIGRDSGMPKRLLRRTLNNLMVIRDNVQTFCNVGAKFFGRQRDGDQYGTLMAGCWSLLTKNRVTSEEALAAFELFDWDELREFVAEDDSVAALNEIMQLTENMPGGLKYSINGLISRALDDEHIRDNEMLSPKEARRVLGLCGIKIEGDFVFISNNSTWIQKQLKGSQYQTAWRDLLLRIEGVERCSKAKRIGGISVKSVAIPLKLITG